MSPAEFQQFILELEYKPDTKFSVQIGDGHYIVYLRMYVSDAKDFSRKNHLMTMRKIDWLKISHMDERELTHWVYDFIRDGEEHEIKEFLKRKGQHLFDPHPEQDAEALKHNALLAKLIGRFRG